jgi:hypothetical protein
MAKGWKELQGLSGRKWTRNEEEKGRNEEEGR